MKTRSSPTIYDLITCSNVQMFHFLILNLWMTFINRKVNIFSLLDRTDLNYFHFFFLSEVWRFFWLIFSNVLMNLDYRSVRKCMWWKSWNIVWGSRSENSTIIAAQTNFSVHFFVFVWKPHPWWSIVNVRTPRLNFHMENVWGMHPSWTFTISARIIRR